MKEIFPCIVILLTILRIKGENYSSTSKSEKRNEIYFTLAKEPLENGISKIKLVIPLNDIIENGDLENNSFKLEKRRRENAEPFENHSTSDSIKFSNRNSLRNLNIYPINNDKLNVRSVSGSDSRADFQQANRQPRYKKETGKYINQPIPSEYRYQDTVTGSYKFGYKTQDQYREEIRTEDGTVRGNFGWMDDTGKWHHTTFISDQYGYRINDHRTSNSDMESSISETRENSSYLSYNRQNETSHKRKITRPVSNRNNGKLATQLSQQSYQEPSILTNLKQKLGLKPEALTSGQRKKDDNVENNLTYVSYDKNETISNNEQTSKKPFENTQSPEAHKIPTKIPQKNTTAKQTITITNLQKLKDNPSVNEPFKQNIFDKLPLKPQKDKVKPGLDKPFKQFSNYLTNMSWPTQSDLNANQILNSLELSGRSNPISMFSSSEKDFHTDHNFDESKILKKFYDSPPIGKDLTHIQSDENIKVTPFEAMKRMSTTYRNIDSFHADYFNPSFIRPLPNREYDLISPLTFSNDQAYRDVSSNEISDKYLLIIPVFFGWHIYNPYQNKNIVQPISSNNIVQYLDLHQPSNNQEFKNKVEEISSSENRHTLLDDSQKNMENESEENDEESEDYLLLSEEFQEINGSITNDPAFGNIQDLFASTNSSTGSQNFTFQKPINIFENNLTFLGSERPPNSTKEKDNLHHHNYSKEHDDDDDDEDEHYNDSIEHDNDDSNEHYNSDENDEYDDDQFEEKSLKPRLIDITDDEETNTHIEIAFKLNPPLIRKNFPVLLNKHIL